MLFLILVRVSEVKLPPFKILALQSIIENVNISQAEGIFMRLIIHAGMNKTGSSSIQDTVSELSRPDLTYVDWKSANHSEMYVLLFQDPKMQARYHIFKTQGWSAADLSAERKVWLKRLRHQMKQNTAPLTVFSGEDISQPGFSEEGVKRMRDFFASYFEDIRVIAYARPPLSFMNSSFQQQVKSGGLDNINIDRLWPSYRKRFEKLDRVFGRENVDLVPFSRETLHGEDVVSDFFWRAGLEQPETLPPSKNDGLSLEALALLFAQRKLGEGLRTGFREATKANNAFVFALSSVWREKFSFSKTLLDGVVERHQSDMDWIEDRIGQPLRDAPKASGRQISCEQDLIDVATEQAQVVQLLELIQKKGRRGRGDPERRLTYLLDCLNRLSG
ncbi:MAG: hypothetical protein ABJZ79_00010 [Parasphingorhabdus sp.]|uniref:hypothetical protein n=1 Tax=Parasphingorhabdus sp. TaxID=2709688 RepID=UPI0032972DA1